MDLITDKIERLCIDEDLSCGTLNSNAVNNQKCYASYKIFNSICNVPGSMFIIQENDKGYLCKLFPKNIFDNFILFDRSVQVQLQNDKLSYIRNDDRTIKISHLKNIYKESTLKVIHIKIVFNNFEAIELWNNRDEELATAVKKYLLNFFTICNDCIISLRNIPETQKMHIDRIIIVNNSHTQSLEFSIGKIVTSTIIKILDKVSKFQFDQMNAILSPLYSLNVPEKRLTEIITMNESFSRNGVSKKIFPPTKQVLIVGPSGCGKSSLVRLVAQKMKCTTVTLLGHEINQSGPGETESALRNVFAEAIRYASNFGKCIINIEEVDNVCPRREGSGSHIQRAVTQLLLLLDKAQTVPGVIILATTNKPDALDPSARRHGRLETEIYIGPPTEKQREEIVVNLITDLNLMLSKEHHTSLSQSIANMTPGYVGADLKLLCQTLYRENMNNEKKIGTENKTPEFWFNAFRNVILSMKPASLKGALGVVTTKHTLFSELAGLDNIKRSLEMAVLWPLKHPNAFKRLGISRPRGVMLYGPPGCAKTSLVRALASLGTFSLLSITAAELYSPYVGDAERLITQLFQRARQNSPCILFIDEIDALAGSRGNFGEKKLDIQERIIASLLTQMDGVGHKLIAADCSKMDAMDSDDGVIVIGATNRPDMVDDALLRPGRFDKHIHVPPPDYSGRLEILKLMTKKMPLAEDVDLNSIAFATELYSGADIKSICTEAAIYAMSAEGMDINIIKNIYFQKAFSNSRPSLNRKSIKYFYDFQFNKNVF